MKRRLFTFALAALTIGLLGSCSKINERIDSLDKRVYDLENTKIASIEQQIAAINQSIADLETIRTNIQNLKNEQEAQGQDITALKAADITLEGKINDLKTYVDTELAKYATKDWANATFATLKKQAEIITDVETLKAGLADLDTKLDQDIANLKTYIEGWVNTQLSAYYKKAEIDVKVGELQAQITTLKEDNETNKTKIAELESNLATLTQDLEEAKATIKTEYEAAITAAINENNGTINQTIQSKIDEVNATITALTGRVEALETTIGVLSGRIDAIEAMIQTVTIVPAYNDGSVESTKDGVLHLDIIVTPAEAVAAITKDCLKVMVNEVKTKAVDLDTVAVTKFKVDAAKGTITARADISSVLPAEGKALTIAVNVRNGISDYTTEFYPVTLSTESNVTVTDEGSTTKVTIKADEDFPESSAGNIVVADGFKDSKPTTVDIEVGGRGTVIFDAKATSQIKANAEQAGATSVFFKVEDVTTTKPVENADVVLEVTMKTVDENGTEVFNKDNAGEGAEVTIEIPIPEEKDVAFVNSVTLVNDAGEPIPGGVVPGSEDFDKEKGILSFKVNHFSKYAIDYVTNDQFVAVTGVSIEPVSVTLQVDDTLRLAAVIAPEDATNKKVTWSSSDTTKVKVDDTGKITAVAFGKATITVTTKDGNKTADCTVKVSETKTMADILKTTTGIPESQNLTPPANAWVNSTNPDCKAFVGIDAEGDKLFVILKAGQELAPLGICMDDAFARIDDNTYQRIEPSVGTFTIKMAEGKFTSYEFAAVSGSAYEQFNGTYSAPVSSPTFKAVYNTNGDANTLTFYYDAVDHSGEGITVYEDGTANYLFDDTQSNGAKWGYNSNRSKIKSVVIDGSVKDYPFLTSTVYMFQGMTIATNISGAEYLDVSNVTNMTGMFWNFGGGSTNSHTTLNSVPDVSKWNTANVTNMTGMFNSYGNFSDNLTIVPDVSNWNTANVTNMANMFQKYGHESTGFNAVPDVSKWNTGKAEDMHQMFCEYGHKSTALTAVPDVCNWNTAEVKTMAEMFREYGASSTVLKAVPDVSGWNTSNVTTMVNMFQKYGKGSVDFVLDLSGWDLSKITSNKGDNVFDFTPNTFTVTIPAKTGEKSNEGGKWYYGDGTNYIAPPAGKTFNGSTPVVPDGFVDLGVKTADGKPLFWAEKNLGADKPEDFGKYFFWGDIVGQPQSGGTFSQSFNPDWSNDPFGYDFKKVSKDIACPGGILAPAYDAATQADQNHKWRTPTPEDFQALIVNCVLVWCDGMEVKYKDTSVPGYIVYKAKKEEDKGRCFADYAYLKWNSSELQYVFESETDPYEPTFSGYTDSDSHIFLPAAGHGFRNELKDGGQEGNYMTSKLSGDNIACEYQFMFRSMNVMPWAETSRTYGCPVRPVSD